MPMMRVRVCLSPDKITHWSLRSSPATVGADLCGSEVLLDLRSMRQRWRFYSIEARLAAGSQLGIAATGHLQAARWGNRSRLYSQMGATLGRRNAAQRTDAMNDTSAEISKVVDDHHLAMTPAERLLAASSLFESARKIVQSSLPSHLTPEERRLAVVRRFYGSELPDVALITHARYVSATRD